MNTITVGQRSSRRAVATELLIQTVQTVCDKSCQNGRKRAALRPCCTETGRDWCVLLMETMWSRNLASHPRTEVHDLYRR